MTLKEFKKRVCEISHEEFRGNYFNPLDHGIERAHFDEGKLRRLIAVGEQAQFQTAQRRVAAWQRQLQRVKAARQRLENTKAGIFPNVPSVISASLPVSQKHSVQSGPIISNR